MSVGSLGATFTRWAKAAQRTRRPWAERELRRLCPQIDSSHATLSSALGAPIAFTYQAERAVFLIRLLEKHRPKRIIELGSGASTIWFNLYARKRGAHVTSLEQSRTWRTAVRRAVQSYGLKLVTA